MKTPLTIRVAGLSHIGMQRSGNEDALGVFEMPHVDAAFVVADGMGGLRAGDVASAEAVRAIEAALRARLTRSPEDLMATVGDAIRLANDAVNALPRPGGGRPVDEPTQKDARRAPEFVPASALMGTTAVVGLAREGVLYLGHAGDSRAYLLRDGQLTRLTEDHSFVAERVRAGDMTENEARRSRFRNMITRAIGIEATVHPDLIQQTLEPDDLVLVCTDGLTTMLEDNEIGELLDGPRTGRQSLEQQVQSLIDAANKRGGADNITVLLIRAHGDGAPPSPGPTRPSERREPAPSTPSRETPRPATQASAGRLRQRVPGLPPLLLALAVVGGFALAGALLVSLSATLRDGLAQRLQRLTPALSPTPQRSEPTDLSALTYDDPVDFHAQNLARGDLLAFQPGVGLYFATNSTGKIAVLSSEGEIVHTIPTLKLPYRAAPAGDQANVQTFLTSDRQGNIYLSHTGRRLIEKYNKDGQRLWQSAKNAFQRPEAVAVDDRGNLYVVDLNYIKVLRARPHLPADKPKKG